MTVLTFTVARARKLDLLSTFRLAEERLDCASKHSAQHLVLEKSVSQTWPNTSSALQAPERKSVVVQSQKWKCWT